MFQKTYGPQTLENLFSAKPWNLPLTLTQWLFICLKAKQSTETTGFISKREIWQKLKNASAAQGLEQTFIRIWSRILLILEELRDSIIQGKSVFFTVPWPCITEKSRESSLWAVEVNKPYKIEILINQAIMNYTLWLTPTDQ